MIGFVIGLLLLVNMGGFASMLFSLRQGQLLGALTTLVVLAVIDMFGFWLLQSMREDR